MNLYRRSKNIVIRHLRQGARRHRLELGSNGPILMPPDDETYETPVLARGVPHLFFNVMWSRDEFRVGATWGRVDRVDLSTGRQDTVFGVPDLEHLAIPGAGSWVRDLLEASDDGETLTVILGVPVAIEDGSR